MIRSIKKAVFPVAGWGTRFLPATKANPKEMLPVVDKPLIQYAVEEAAQAGATQLIFITNSNKRAIEDHFDTHYELEEQLARAEKQALLDTIRDILPKNAHCIYIRQPLTLGLGHAVLCAKPIVEDEPFLLLLADDLIDSPQQSGAQQLLNVYYKTGMSVVAVQAVDWADTDKYGIVATEPLVDNFAKVTQIVEKPARSQSPSNLAVIGRYLLTPSIFTYLEQIQPGINGEYQLTDALAQLANQESLEALKLIGTRYDCGTKLGYLQATIQYALKHPELTKTFSDYLKALKF